MARRRPTHRRRSNSNIKDMVLLPSPSSLLNCACTDTTRGAFPIGSMANIIGDSHTGKSIFALSILAEAFYNPIFKDYTLIYDDAEHANLFDMRYLFGPRFAKALQAPYYEDEIPIHSDMIEDFHCNIIDALESEKPFIYVVDSWDSLNALQDAKKMKEMRIARRKGVKAKGSYGMAKPKKASDILKEICGMLSDTRSILFIISQTRDNINPMSFSNTTRSGGRALKFYAFTEMWLAHIRAIRGPNKKIIGNVTRIKVSKTKATGKVREVDSHIYNDYGVDDIGPSIDYLIDEGDWTKPPKSSIITAPNLDLKGQKKKLIETIETQNLEEELKKEVGRTWKKVEESLKLNRKPRYR